MSRKLPDLLAGFIVLIIAAGFLVYALGRAQALGGSGYVLNAQFSNIGGLADGADVKIGGVVVGHVVDEHLDPQTYAAVVKLQINNNIQLPDDTSATISSDGLLGGNYVGLSPGGSDSMFKPGAAFQVTQSAVNIEDLLGKFIFSMGDMGKPGAKAGGQGAPPAPGGAAPGGMSNPAALPAAGGSAPGAAPGAATGDATGDAAGPSK